MLPFLAGLGIRQWVTDHATALMWASAFGVAVIVAFWDQIRIRRRPARAQNASLDFLELKILKADWGNAASQKPVDDIIRQMPRNALMFVVNPDAFRPYDPSRADPAFGQDKYLDVTYSYTGSGPLTVRRTQGEWIILPEDPVARAAPIQTKSTAAKENEGGYIKYSEVPQLLIRYVVRDGREYFIFRNDGHVSLQRISIGPLFMSGFDLQNQNNSASKTIEIICLNVLGALSPGEEAESGIVVSENHTIQPLPAFLRGFLRIDWTIDYSITAKYEDMQGRQFSRMFIVAIDSHDKVAIEASQPAHLVSGGAP